MKKRTAIFSFLLFSGANALVPFIENASAEEYICADVRGEERPTYKRINNTKFISNITLDGENSTSEYSIAKETKNFIVLIETFDYRDSWTTVLDKKNKEYSETYTNWENGKDPEVSQSFGPCLVVD
tara:strand:- start:69 stop:449 length:381 start_codon:yes stop_codon:yes gene_type:complete